MRTIPTGTVLFYLALVLFVSAGLSLPAAAVEACGNCPPAYCQDPSRANTLKAAKKAQAEARGLPPRLSALFDRLPNCAACIEQAPDWPYLIWNYDLDRYEEVYGVRRAPTSQMAWSRNTEQQARDDMRSGLVTDYYISLESSPCYCCSDSTGGRRAWSAKMSPGAFAGDQGWNAGMQLMETSALHVNQVALGDDDPADLGTIAPALAGRQPVPGEVDAFLTERPLRVLQVSCPDCQGKADTYNSIAETVNRARWHLATLRRDLAYEQAMIGWRWEQENRLYGLANTPANLDKIDTNKKQRDAAYNRVNTLEQSLAGAAKTLAEKEAKLSEAMQAVRGCDPERCAEASQHDTSPGSGQALTAVAAAPTARSPDTPVDAPDQSPPSPLDTASAPLHAEGELARQALDQQSPPATAQANVNTCPRCAPIAEQIAQLDQILAELEQKVPAARKKAKDLQQSEVVALMDRTGLEQNSPRFARELGGEKLVAELREANLKVSQASSELVDLLRQIDDKRAQRIAAHNRLEACLRSCAMDGGEYTLISELGPFEGTGLGAWDYFKKRRINSKWVDIATECTQCQPIVDQYNELMREIFRNRDTLKLLINHQDYVLNSSRGKGSLGRSNPDGSLGEFGLSWIFLWAMQTDEIINQLRELLITQERFARELAVTLQLCETSCSEERTGQPVSLAAPAFQPALTALPFDWAGPYSTDCWHCEKLVAELNRLPALARERLLVIGTADSRLAYLRARKDMGENPNRRQTFGREGFIDAPRLDYEITELEQELGKARRELSQITAQFNTVLGMLQDCESLPQCTQVYQDPVVELQQTFTRLGFNGFVVSDVQNILTGVIAPPSQPPVVTPPTQPPVTPPTQPPVTPPTEPPVTPPTQPPTQPPAPPPFNVVVTGSFSFQHIVGTTVCPTPAGTARISSNNGNPLRVSNVRDSGTIASLLDQQVAGNNSSNPSIQGSFNCSSPQAGNFNGQVTATITDTVTGESRTITIRAEGVVQGG